jgi:threonine/homoserine/homoserine lactone efflux protein
MILLLKSIFLGIVIAAPVGPMAILCMNRTLNKGFFSGLATGFGIASADGIYACIVGFGLTAISNFLIAHAKIIHVIGGLLLCYIGIKILLSKQTSSNTKSKSSSDFLSSFFLTLTNPMTVIAFIAVFSGLGIGTTHPDFIRAITIIFGIFLGSFFWWLTLSMTITIVHHRIESELTKWVNLISGLIILGFGLWMIF